MAEKIVSIIYYRLLLLSNLENDPEGGGDLIIDTYTFDPGLAQGDEILVQDWKVPVVKEAALDNETLSFSARVMEIKKIAVRNQSFEVHIRLESPDRETIAQIREALRASNPDQFPKK